ncbi:Predicted secreted hydrolase [Monaibacterium marinum]|uniref:Predicted secreted hydrolase n=1 Tax=Pontivivens marinum TaxID=1690039 RepID=A0A2C9CS84_9RHOB|nr:lipocalin-like domain-containing protein [Monaibacterium marinum]SOH94204.1 Predicted secreted hydrolase [Monaibacterium marinum]
MRFLWILMLLPGLAFAQGFAGLGNAPQDGFATPERGVSLSFPADHGSHPDYRIEWWYLTANMTGPDGTQYGAQWTLFRSALDVGERPDWDSPQIWMAHAALTSADQHFVAEKFARGGIGQAGVVAQPFEAWIDDWQMSGPTLNNVTVQASGQGFSYALDLRADAPFTLQGDAGYSVKSAAGQASYYYSQPFYDLSGVIEVEGVQVPVTGQAWLDREWSSQPLAETQTGWDWFSLQLDGGERVMAFRLRDEAGQPFHSGTWIAADGTVQPLANDALLLTPLAIGQSVGPELPVEWRVQVPSRGLDVTTTALNVDSWMGTLFPYWEGPIRIEGSHSGVGYLEMTGYD